MKTRTLSIHPDAVDAALVSDMASVLLGDGVMAFPTETFYGLGGAALRAKAVSKIYRLKGRDPGKPLPLIASDIDMVAVIARPLPPLFWTAAEEFWPGPLTLVLQASPSVPEFLAGPGGTVAVRVPPLAWVRRLAYEISQPLTATSANLTGDRELADPGAVGRLFMGKVDLIVDGGTTPGGLPSTILDLTGPEPRLLRPGAVSAERIKAVLGV